MEEHMDCSMQYEPGFELDVPISALIGNYFNNDDFISQLEDWEMVMQINAYRVAQNLDIDWDCSLVTYD